MQTPGGEIRPLSPGQSGLLRELVSDAPAHALIGVQHPDIVIDRVEVLELVPVSYPTLWKWMRSGRFPRALRIGEQKLAWREDEIRAWIDSRPRQELKGDGADSG